MPTYDYKCKSCGRVFEAFHSMNDEPLSVCESCGGELKRMIGSGSGIIFKGSGFYVTDYKNKSEACSSPSASSKDTKSACGSDSCCCDAAPSKSTD